MAAALLAAYPTIPQEGLALIFPTPSPDLGDYQCNRALQMARQARVSPRVVAEQALARASFDDLCQTVEIAGPGFINFRLRPEWVGEEVRQRLADERLGVPRVARPRTVVLDFSSPNVAKPMHIGHIRSTVIGDVLNRVMRFLGHKVITDNHLGDWGTQFGILILGYREFADEAALEADPIHELKRVYKLANERCNQDPAWADRARAELVKLQAGEAENLALWQRFIALSRSVFEGIYERLDVHFDLWLGESFYNPMLPGVVEELLARGIAREDQGAVAIFFPDDPELADKPLLIRKKDGGYLYATTDLAAIKYRVETFHPDAILYIVDGRQQLHFKQVFAAARRWGYTEVELSHPWFGTILGADGRPIKTREGEPPELAAVLDEAEERALAIVREKSPELPPERQREVARVVGIGAVKYADLSQNRTSDYVFSWDKMLAMVGNTAPYLQYAYVRIQSILDKGGIDAAALEQEPPPVHLDHPAELALAKHLLRFADALEDVLEDYRPNVLTGYLYDLASHYSRFYESCPVLGADEPVRSSRLALCHLTALTLARGLDLLGIKTLPRM